MDLNAPPKGPTPPSPPEDLVPEGEPVEACVKLYGVEAAVGYVPVKREPLVPVVKPPTSTNVDLAPRRRRPT